MPMVQLLWAKDRNLGSSDGRSEFHTSKDRFDTDLPWLTDRQPNHALALEVLAEPRMIRTPESRITGESELRRGGQNFGSSAQSDRRIAKCYGYFRLPILASSR